ncbi:MAG: GNAT family N-acetyltransferase, partial [Anaerolineae bacterium]|nr:GNAT family N-acetyltransferase [Anaerolineae bacterium]
EFHTELDPALDMHTDSEALESMRTYLQAGLENPDSRLLVAEIPHAPGLAGFLFAHVRTISPLAVPPTAGFISDICVDDHLRRHGIGRELFLTARDWFRERGQTIVRLNVAATNPVAQAYWRALGLQELMLVMQAEL